MRAQESSTARWTRRIFGMVLAIAGMWLFFDDGGAIEVTAWQALALVAFGALVAWPKDAKGAVGSVVDLIRGTRKG